VEEVGSVLSGSLVVLDSSSPSNDPEPESFHSVGVDVAGAIGIVIVVVVGAVVEVAAMHVPHIARQILTTVGPNILSVQSAREYVLQAA
jgi:hypothetical protein